MSCSSDPPSKFPNRIASRFLNSSTVTEDFGAWKKKVARHTSSDRRYLYAFSAQARQSRIFGGYDSGRPLQYFKRHTSKIAHSAILSGDVRVLMIGRHGPPTHLTITSSHYCRSRSFRYSTAAQLLRLLEAARNCKHAIWADYFIF